MFLNFKPFIDNLVETGKGRLLDLEEILEVVLQGDDEDREVTFDEVVDIVFACKNSNCLALQMFLGILTGKAVKLVNSRI